MYGVCEFKSGIRFLKWAESAMLGLRRMVSAL